ncbi:MAG: DUF350 domain-containing protein [Pseudomonadota bacterium]
MKLILITLISGIPYFLSFLLTALAIVFLGVWVYSRITPYDELELIKKRNISASISLSATIIGITLPIAFCLASSVNIYDLIIWGFVSLIVQILMFFLMDKILKDISQKVQEDNIAATLLYSMSKISSAIILSATIVG